MAVCRKCGNTLVAGENWYRMKPDHICCKCSSYPTYIAKPKQYTCDGDYEGKILARQESYYD